MKDKFVYSAKVVSVYDGDTITADIDLGFGIFLKKQKFRLSGINAPEMRGKDKAQGKISRDALRKYVLDKDVLIQTFRDKKGKYGRWIATIWTHGVKTSINSLMVRRKFAVRVKY